MSPEPRRESHRSNYIRTAAYQIAHTPKATPKEFPGSFEETEKYTERQVKDVPHPATNRPTDEEFFAYDRNGAPIPSLDFIRGHFIAEGRLTEQQAIYILERTTDLLSREPNLLSVPSPVTVCGDIHGQYYDLMKIFEVGGTVAENSYLFLGDYVDRGSFGIECLLYLYVFKLWHPNRVFLIRGNHECQHLTTYFTFRRECLFKYSERVYDASIRSFNALPLAAVIDKRFFCVHGGISPELVMLRDLEKLDRFHEPGSHGLLVDLLWADPVPTYGHEQEDGKIPPGTMYIHNSARGCSFYYTYEAVCAFLVRNNLLGVFRGHEAQDAGYTMHRKTPTKKFPSVITVFSAPNYLDAYHNRGAVLKYANKNITIRQYNCSPHPYWLPNFMDGFTWSLPFVGAKIAEMLLAILSICSAEELEESSEESTDVSDEEDGKPREIPITPDLAARRQVIKNKILAVGRLQRVFTILREEAEGASELARAAPGPTGALGARLGPDALGVHGNQQIRSFDEARRSDMSNERLPNFDLVNSKDPLTTAPSMRQEKTEDLIKKALEEDEEGDSVVERLADRITRGRKPQGRPRGLKRFETT
ncbi:Metallo-dependent phosphatase [Thelephora ganbajun]|uniref:Metallo-dependent phosphatase n=1 Tax=Thelephora ganbajun TaxID=370292 RepID=A0ACB6ZVX6_THEGA|nr:Metallo-dependent phosphatase [Thelephora ganbajun]